jgi:acetyl/propionyl-CoA carboxylase alpha subunit
MRKFSKILIANRGEIALRIIRAARDMGILTVAIYSEGEENALHVLRADEAISLGSGNLSSTYLNIDIIIEAALISGADAVHPGYGFLSENPLFAEKCASAGIVFIGPSTEVLQKMGNKVTAKEIASLSGVDVLATTPVVIADVEKMAPALNYPLMIKASHGGGGKGMQVVRSAPELIDKSKAASRKAESYFGNGEIYLEAYIPSARHIEVQILGDKFGNLVHLFERDCTLQRNHQKIVEEAPAVSISDDLRSQLHRAALKIGHSVGYQNAGTVEFLVDESENFFFLEVNPRIQVEHPITEQITGIDLVKEQLLIAAGNPLSFSQDEVFMKGHSIEVRIYSEDPLNGFAPSGKGVSAFHFPTSSAVRVESAIAISSENALLFDPLLCKIIVTGSNREDARLKLISALSETAILGTKTNLAFLLEIIKSDHFGQNQLTTEYCSLNLSGLLDKIRTSEALVDSRFLIAVAIDRLFCSQKNGGSVWGSIGFWRLDQRVELILAPTSYHIRFSRKKDQLTIEIQDNTYLSSIKKMEDNLYEVTIGQETKRLLFLEQPGAKVLIGIDGFSFEAASPDLLRFYPDENSVLDDHQLESTDNLIKSRLYGKIISIHVKTDQTIDKGDLLLVIESMKSENMVLSHRSGTIAEITVEVGDQVFDQMPLIYFEEE